MGWGFSPTLRPPLPPRKTRYPLYCMLGGPQGRSGQAENLVPTGIRSRTVQPIVSRYTDWVTRPVIINIYIYIYLSYKYNVFNAWGRSVRLKHVAYIDKINKVCCGWKYMFSSFYYDVPKMDEFCKTKPLRTSCEHPFRRPQKVKQITVRVMTTWDRKQGPCSSGTRHVMAAVIQLCEIFMVTMTMKRMCTTAYKPYAVVHSLVLLKMGIMMSETCWDRRLTINIRFVASSWFLSLHHIFEHFCFVASKLTPARLVSVRATTFSRFSQSLQVRVGLKIIGRRVNVRMYEWRISMWIDEWINSRTYELATPKNGDYWTGLSHT